MRIFLGSLKSHLNQSVDVIERAGPPNDGEERRCESEPSQQNGAGVQAKAEKSVERQSLRHFAYHYAASNLRMNDHNIYYSNFFELVAR